MIPVADVLNWYDEDDDTALLAPVVVVDVLSWYDEEDEDDTRLLVDCVNLLCSPP